MLILGIESSCDETAAAVVEDGRRLYSNVVNSQIDIHSQYGGVIPEVAARSHLEVINPVIHKALADANVTWDDINAIAVTYAPGLSGSLLIGTIAAKTLAYLKNKPLYPIHHVEAHVYANFITETGLKRASEADSTMSGNLQPLSGATPSARSTNAVHDLLLPQSQPTFPMLALIVSGGHSQLVLFRDHGDYTLLGQTQDDAVGEAFDKVAKMLGLPYPGGPSISKAAESGNPFAYDFPKAKLAGAYDFSFSGLKTAVLRRIQREVGVDFTFPSHELPARVNEQMRYDFAASFQRIAIETLVDKAKRAFYEYQPASVVIAGGVAANQELRRQLSDALPLSVEYAPIQLCTDNAAMIATLGYYESQRVEPTSPFALEIKPSLSMIKEVNVA